MILLNQEKCVKVLEDLDGDPGLNAWEDGFVRDLLSRYRLSCNVLVFTDPQRNKISEIAEKFEI